MKRYVMPSVKVIEVKHQELLCMSLPIDTSEVVTGGWTRQGGGWNSEDWSDLDQEVED